VDTHPIWFFEFLGTGHQGSIYSTLYFTQSFLSKEEEEGAT